MPEVNKRISMIRRLREYFSSSTLLKLVEANITPKMLYGAEVWCNVTSGHESGVLKRLEILYKEAIRAALGVWRGSMMSSETLWEKSKMEKPGRIILKRVAVAAFDIYNDTGAWRFLERPALHFTKL